MTGTDAALRDRLAEILVVGETRVCRAGPRWTVTVLCDGAVVHAEPHDDAEYAARASALGYGEDVAAMSYEHELVHTLLAHWLGLPESPVMRAVADGSWQSDSTGALAAEEAAVLAVQRLARLHRVDLSRLSAGGATVRPAGLNVVRVPDWVGGEG